MSTELLLRAADLIEQRAAGTTPGPWRWDTVIDIDELTHPMSIAGMPVHPLNVLKVGHEDWPPTEADKAWIAMLSPQVAAPLAAWLRAECSACACMHLDPSREAIAVATAILGEQS